MTPEEVDYALYRLNDRLRKVETHLGLRNDAAPAQPATPAQSAAPRPAEGAGPAPAAAPRPDYARRPGNWLGIAAVICFVIAAGFIVQLTIESGWLTPIRQIGLAVVLGLALIGAGFGLRSADREYASLLPAAGVVVLYLSVLAAYGLYHLLSFDIGLAATAVVSVICIWLYVEMRHDIYAIVAAVGAYASPLLLDYTVTPAFTLYYLLFCSLAFSIISIWLRTRTLTLVSAYLALLITAGTGLLLPDKTSVAELLGIHFLIFAAGTWLYTVHTRAPLTEAECWSLLPLLLAFYGIEYFYLSTISPHLAPWVSLGFAAVLGGLYLGARKALASSPGSEALIVIFATVAVVHSAYLVLLPEALRPWLVAAALLAVALTPVRNVIPQMRGAFLVPLAALGLIAAVEYLSILSNLLTAPDANWLAVSFVTFGGLWLIILRGGDLIRSRDSWAYAALGLAHLLGIMAFYRLAAGAGSLAVSASWLLYAVAVTVFAFARRDEVMARSALAVLALAAGKALLYDTASAPSMVRIVCLLLTGAVLYGCGLLMRRIAFWSKDRPRPD